MKSRHKKLALIGGALAIIGLIAALVLNALNSNIALYISPSEVAEGKAPQGKLFRIGGLVKEGSIQRQAAMFIHSSAPDPPARSARILFTSWERKMPTTMANCCSDPSRPRMWAGAISAM